MRNPIDRYFKNTAEIEPRALMHLFGNLRIDEPAEVRELGREIALEAVHLDHLYDVHTPWWHGLCHFEFQTKYRVQVPKRIAHYQQVAYLRYELPIQSSLILPFQKFAPATIPDSYEISAGGLAIQCRYRVIRMWEVDPEEIFALNRPPLLPLISLASRTRRDLNRAARQIVESGNQSLAETFMNFGSIRYDRTELEGLLEKVIFEELMKPEWVRQSSVFGPMLEEAEIEARKKGRWGEAQRMLARVIAKRFPGLTVPAYVQAITDVERIEDLCDLIVVAPSAAEAEAALSDARPESNE